MVRPDLRALLSRHQPQATEELFRFNARLRATTDLSGELPPVDLVSAVRAVVLPDKWFVLQEDRIDQHLIPGGRREPAETLEATLQREVVGETSWTITNLQLIGFIHIQPLAPEPRSDRYPHPDFLHLVYPAGALTLDER